MAVIKCFECGNSVSDKAEICPHCGIKEPGIKRGSGNGRLVVTRLGKYAIYGQGAMSWMWSATIFIDNKEMGKVSNNSTFSIELPADDYTIEVSIPQCKPAKKNIIVPEGGTLNLTTYPQNSLFKCDAILEIN